VIQRLAPAAVAMRPSSEVAVLSANQGRPRRTRLKKPALSARASLSRTPSLTAIPARRSRSTPRPDTRGSGSSAAITARAMPAATSASAHGGVWPWCAQGSSET
jgi:hypothetical protein